MILQRDIVLLSFPFSDLRSSKVRPAIVLSNDKYNKGQEDFVAVPLTTNLSPNKYGILVTNDELESGRLIVDSKARVDKAFSVEKRLVRMKIGKINKATHLRMVRLLAELVR